MDERFYILINVCSVVGSYHVYCINAVFILVFVILGGLICILGYRCKKEREISCRIEKDLQVHELYDESFKSLLDTITKKQHEYHNHIQAILSMHYSIHTYEELVQEQNKYCESLAEDTRYFHLLNGNWPVLMGFLYSKFIEADKMGIEVKYSIKIRGRVYTIPEFVMVEVLGILLDNAIEAVEGIEHPVIYVNIEDQEKFVIEIGNPAENISYKKMSQFFEKGYTSKVGHPGLGLCKLVEYGQRYGFERKVLKMMYEGRECFVVRLRI